jgi:hypothetical protein
VVIAIVFFLQDRWSGRVTAAYLGLLMVCDDRHREEAEIATGCRLVTPKG